MNKRIIPALLGAFLFSFSGKSHSNFKCGPRIDIDAPNSGQVTSVEVRNITTGNTTTYNNPSFPITHVDQGTQIEVKFYLNGNYHFAIYQDSDAGECNAVNYHPASQGSLTFDAYCRIYGVRFIETSDGDNFLCP